MGEGELFGDIRHFLQEKYTKFMALNFPIFCPHAPLVKVFRDKEELLSVKGVCSGERS